MGTTTHHHISKKSHFFALIICFDEAKLWIEFRIKKNFQK